MSSSANVRSIEALEDLRNALIRFKYEALDILRYFEGEIQRTQIWLQERLQYWQNELKRRLRKLEEAQAALRRCEALARDSRPAPDCSTQQINLKWARQQVLEAEQELLIVREHMRRVEEASTRYQYQARQLSETLDNELLKGTELLKKSVDILQSYSSGKLEGAAYLDAEMSSGAATPASIALQATTPVFSLMTTQNAAYSGGYRVAPHSDIQMIPLDQIDVSDSWVVGPEDFRKDSNPQALEEAFRKLQDVVIPALAKGADSDYFAQLDASQGLQNADSYLNVYNVFYGDDAIRLEMVGKQYKVVGGFHRLYIAGQLGLEAVPARVISRQP